MSANVAGNLGRWVRRNAIPPTSGASANILRWVWRNAYSSAIEGKLCIGAITITLPSMTTAFSVPSAMVAMTLPSMTIEIEDCP